MTAQAGSSPERHRDLTRPDLPLPRSGSGGAPAPAPPPPLTPPVPPEPVPPQVSASRGKNWHRLHSPVGVFLIAYGITGFGTGLLGWDDRREELAGYIGTGLATPGLVMVKVIELALVALTVAGLLRRRDVWFLPVLAGWLAGFGVFTLLDIFKGKWGGLVEHLVFLAAFALLLFLSYGLSVKARVGRAGRATPPPPAPVPVPNAPAPPVPPVPPVPLAAPAPAGNLSRTQEFALAALNRLQQRITPALGSPSPQPRPHVPAPAPPADEPPPSLESEHTVVDAEMPEAAGEDDGKTVQTPLPEPRPAPPDPTRPLPLPDSPDQQG